MKLLGITKNKINKDENCENVPLLEITGLVQSNIANNDYRQDSRVFYSFGHNKSFGQLLDISSRIFKFLKTFHSEFSSMEVWFTDENSKPLDIEDKIDITSVIN